MEFNSGFKGLNQFAGCMYSNEIKTISIDEYISKILDKEATIVIVKCYFPRNFKCS